MSKRLIPLAAIEKLLKEAGAERVSEGAKQETKEALEKHARVIGKLAAKFAQHAGRKTVQAEDIKMALQTFSR